MLFLVTGAAGGVGFAVVERLLERGSNVLGVDVIDLPASAVRRVSELPGKLDFRREDIRTFALPTEYSGREVRILHTAVVTPNPDVERAIPREIMTGNIDMTAAILDLARACEATYTIHVSSGGIYGNLEGRDDLSDGLISEIVTHPRPQNLYAISKLTCEQMVGRYRELFAMPVVVARVALTFGPWERITGARSLVSAPHQIVAHARAGRRIVLERDSTRGWTSSRDIARTLVALAEKKEMQFDLLNVSTPHRWPLSDFLTSLRRRHPNLQADASGTKTPNTWLRFGYDAPNHDISRLLAAVGPDLLMTQDEAIEDYLDWAERYWGPEFNRLA